MVFKVHILDTNENIYVDIVGEIDQKDYILLKKNDEMYLATILSDIKLVKLLSVIKEKENIAQCANIIEDETEYKFVRKLNEDEIQKYLEYKQEIYKIFEYTLNLIEKYQLKMNLIDIEPKYDNTKLVFFYNANERIDFRELVKELAKKYHSRIEMKQIFNNNFNKEMDRAKCGRELCCMKFGVNQSDVNMKMAKNQNLSTNPSSISGNCGNLMCCLKFENEVYKEKRDRMPKKGDKVKTENGEGIVDSLEILKEEIRVKHYDADEYYFKKYNLTDIEIIE